MTTTKTVDPLDTIKDSILLLVKPLMTGEILKLKPEEVEVLTANVRAIYEMATKIRESHDKAIVAWEEVHGEEPMAVPQVQTIRARKGSKTPTGGFLKGL